MQELNEKCDECGANKVIDEHGICFCPNCKEVSLFDIIRTQREWNKKQKLQLYKWQHEEDKPPKPQRPAIAFDGIGKKDGEYFIDSPRIDTMWDSKNHRCIVIKVTGWVSITKFNSIMETIATQFQDDIQQHIKAFEEAKLTKKL